MELSGHFKNIADSVATFQPEELCPVCGKPKTASKMKDGKRVTFPVACGCIQAKQVEEQHATELKRHEIELRQRWDKSSFAMTTFRRDTFAADDGGNQSVSAVCRKYVDQWDEVRKDNLGILFYGSVGTGKTFLAHAIANALIDKCVDVIVTNFSRILNTLQACKDRQRELDALNSYSLLVIDDLGAERSSDFAREMVYSVIDQRGQVGLPLIVTTNLSIDEMQNTQDMQLRRIYDRLLYLCNIPFLMNGTSRRINDTETRRAKARDLLL